MHSYQVEILSTAKAWLEAGVNGWLCTVLSTWGSSPRPVGSFFAFNENLSQTGSLSGGCIEEDLIQQVLKNMPEVPTIYLYKGSDNGGRALLPCGGELTILVEPLTPNYLAHLDELLAALSLNRTITRSLVLEDNTAEISTSDDSKINLLSFTTRANTLHTLTQTLTCEHAVFIIGATEVGFEIARLAKRLNWFVTLCDPRENVTVPEELSTRITRQLPDEALMLKRASSYNNTAILAVTHDPRVDDMGLLQAFKTNACYIGAMGSKKSTEKRIERLTNLGVERDELSRLKAPIGISIPSKKPTEIAIAVVADLIKVFNAS